MKNTNEIKGKERLLAVVRGEAQIGKLPWTSRIDLWYRAHHRNGTLPDKWEGYSMWDIMREIGGLLYYPNVPTWRERLWGVMIVETVDGKKTGADQPITSSFTGRKFWGLERIWGTTTITEYITPKGAVTTKHVLTNEMWRHGVQLPQLKEPMIKSLEDYPIVEYIIEHTEFLPNYDELNVLIKDFGDDGIPIAGAGITPIHYLMKDYFGYGECFYHMYDHPKEFEHLLEVMRECVWDAKKIAARSPGEIVLIGANWTDSITSPPIFKKYFIPDLENLVDLMHSHNKLTSCHVDGDMKWLFKDFVTTGVDIAEALAPAPLCNFTLAEAREILDDRMTIWGGIPTPLFTETYSDVEFEEYVKEVFRTIAPGNHFILAMADNIPPNGVFERVAKVTKMVEKLGELPI